MVFTSKPSLTTMTFEFGPEDSKHLLEKKRNFNQEHNLIGVELLKGQFKILENLYACKNRWEQTSNRS